MKMASRQALKKSLLIPKSILLPSLGIKLNYYERPATVATMSTSKNSPPPTLLFCHGLSDQAKNLAPFISSLKIPPHVRILVPDAIGHGRDLIRAKKDYPNFVQPTSTSLLESTAELLQVLDVKKCHAFGYSVGGALVYFLKIKCPIVIHKTVLVSPALESCLDPTFIDDFQSGRKNHWCLTSRDDAKRLFRDLSAPNRKKKDPIPKFWLQAIYKLQVTQAPPGHYRAMLEGLLRELGQHSQFQATTDVDVDSPRLVFWPDQDFICNHDAGQSFFANSGPDTQFETVPDCGHMFHSDGTFVLDLVRPQVERYLLDFE